MNIIVAFAACHMMSKELSTRTLRTLSVAVNQRLGFGVLQVPYLRVMDFTKRIIENENWTGWRGAFRSGFLCVWTHNNPVHLI